MSENETQGLALVCDSSGLIQKVLRNDLNLVNVVPGFLFIRLFEKASRTKAMTFLTEINKQGAVLDWELNIQTETEIISLFFTGNLLDDVILINAGNNRPLARRLYEDMLRINNEQTNILRSTIKDKIEVSRIAFDSSQYDQITQLNNELVILQRQLAKKNAELAGLNVLKNQFLGMAAHDLRSAMQSIMHYCDLLLAESPVLVGFQLELVTAINSQGHFMSSMVNDLLDIATIESGNLHLDLQPIDLVDLVKANLVRNQVIASRKNIFLTLDAEFIQTALLDPVKLEQVIDNLVSNAIKFSPPDSNVLIQLRAAESEIFLSVKDEGPGIPDNEIETLFQPFQKTSVKSSAGEKSIGLGLAIVKYLVTGHGGKIRVESQVGIGSTFHVSLPILLS